MRVSTPTNAGAGAFSGRDGDPGTGPVCACGGRDTWRSGGQQEATGRRRAGRSAADPADIAAAEDFDPLRVRPYVMLSDDMAPEADDERFPHHGRPHGHPVEDANATMPLRLGPTGPVGGPTAPDVPGQPGGPGQPGRHPGRPADQGLIDDPEEIGGSGWTGRSGWAGGPPPQTVTDPVVDATVVMPPAYAPAPGHASADAPGATSSSTSGATSVGRSADVSDRPGRRGPLAALAVGAAALAVVGTAVFASGLFESSDDRPADRELALPDLPLSTPEVSAAAEESASAPAPTPSAGRASATPSASSSAGTRPSPSASATGVPPDAPDVPSPSATAPRASRPASAAPPASLAGSTLRPGDRGPAVAELQRRLEEVWLFDGQDDGDYTAKVEHAVSVYQSYKFIQGDPRGTYGPHTRRALEAETSGRGRS